MSFAGSRKDVFGPWVEDARYSQIQSDRKTLYPLVDMVPYSQLSLLGLNLVPGDVSFEELLRLQGRVRARWAGEVRPPRKGEWFLSGALVEAYLAREDMTVPAHIANLVLVEKQTSHMVREVIIPH